MHGREDTQYGVAGGQARSAAALCDSAMIMFLAGLGVCLLVAVEVTTAFTVDPGAAAAVNGTIPVAVRPFELSSLSLPKGRPSSSEAAGGLCVKTAPGFVFYGNPPKGQALNKSRRVLGPGVYDFLTLPGV